jgi:hypothetical protein
VPWMLTCDRFSGATAGMDTSATMLINHRCSLHRVLQLHAWSLFDFCDARFSRLAAVSALTKRFMAAMINTFSSVNPRVVIFHMTASRLVRSIALLGQARAVPNGEAQVSDGKRGV